MDKKPKKQRVSFTLSGNTVVDRFLESLDPHTRVAVVREALSHYILWQHMQGKHIEMPDNSIFSVSSKSTEQSFIAPRAKKIRGRSGSPDSDNGNTPKNGNSKVEGLGGLGGLGEDW